MGLLRWLGFVKLADYGLELTPERRIRTRSWAVLDDGSGGAIVGWTVDDANVDQLRKWQLVRPQAQPRPKDDDEWEWMIAAARARAQPPAAPAPPRAPSPDALLDDQPTQAPIGDELPTQTWVDDGNTEIDPDRPGSGLSGLLPA